MKTQLLILSLSFLSLPALAQTDKVCVFGEREPLEPLIVDVPLAMYRDHRADCLKLVDALWPGHEGEKWIDGVAWHDHGWQVYTNAAKEVRVSWQSCVRQWRRPTLDDKATTDAAKLCTGDVIVRGKTACATVTAAAVKEDAK